MTISAERQDHKAGPRRERAGPAAHARAEHRGEVDDIGTRQELAERVDVVELLRRHPALLFDEHPPRPRQRAAEAHDGDLEEGEEKFGVGGNVGRGGLSRACAGGVGHDGQIYPRCRWPHQSIYCNARYERSDGAVRAYCRGACQRSFFINLQRLYWGCRGNPAMAINGAS